MHMQIRAITIAPYNEAYNKLARSSPARVRGVIKSRKKKETDRALPVPRKKKGREGIAGPVTCAVR